MPGGNTYSKGSKRNLRKIRRTRSKMVSAALLLLAMLLVSVGTALWLSTHVFD